MITTARAFGGIRFRMVGEPSLKSSMQLIVDAESLRRARLSTLSACAFKSVALTGSRLRLNGAYCLRIARPQLDADGAEVRGSVSALSFSSSKHQLMERAESCLN
jgi:hypothetical protein